MLRGCRSFDRHVLVHRSLVMIHTILRFVEHLPLIRLFFILGTAPAHKLVVIETGLPGGKQADPRPRSRLLAILTSHGIRSISSCSEWDNRDLLRASLASIPVDSNRLFFEFNLRWLPIVRTTRLFQVNHFVCALESRGR